MVRFLKYASVVIGGLLLFYVFRAYISPVPWAWDTATICARSESAALCTNSYLGLFWVYFLATILFIGIALKTGNLLRTLLVMVLFGYLGMLAQDRVISELSHVQTYSYEVFIFSFYYWCAASVTCLVACFLWPNAAVRIVRYTAIGTILCAVLFAFEGRGSVEHINPLLGGLLVEFKLEYLKAGFLWKLASVLALSAVVFFPFRLFSLWIIDGAWKWRHAARTSVLVIAGFVGIGVLPLVSVPAGMVLHQYDIRVAKEFVNAIVPKLQAYYDEHEEYPSDLFAVMEKYEKAPRLLDIYEYFTFGTKGGYYLSRPQKYCFIVPDTSIDAGYLSLTSARKWRYSHPGKALEDEFEAICDENMDDVHEELVAGHLGLPDTDDPIAYLGSVVGEVRQPAMTQAATPRLEEALHDLGHKDPDIYKVRERPELGKVDPKALLEQLKQQPLRTD